MTWTVIVADKVAERGLAILRDHPDLEVISVPGDLEGLVRELPRAHALLVRSDTQVTNAVIERSPALKVIARAGIGVDNIDVAAATHRGIAVLNAPGANTVSAAEHAVGLLLALVRRIPWALDSMRRGEWDRKTFSGTELRGKTLGVVGLGRIGAHVAGIARAFGMRVIAHDPFLAQQRAEELRVELVKIERLLSEADVVTLHLPMTDSTRNIIDADRLRLMKPTAVIINTARGGLVNEEALVEAVSSERIAGAAVDVFMEEPLPADSPLRNCDRLLVTPHLAASTAEAQDRVAEEICEALRDALVSGDIGGAINVPGVSGEAMQRLRPLLDLARRLGRLAAAVARGRVQGIEVHYGGPDDDAPRPTAVAALEGALSAMGIGPVSLVNASALASERAISVSRRAGAPVKGFETTVGVTVQTDERGTTVVGALVGDRIRTGRIVRIDDYAVDVPAEGAILVLRNRDVPGVIGRVGSVLGECQINIGSYHQSRRSEDDDAALAAIMVDQPPARDVVRRLESLADVTEVRVAVLDGNG